ncbi:paired box protein pax-6, putative [Schistosoma mansoni]|nr:paired box protein pax-6, putative [Schistosoma mansoni]|eukprot:XP_018646266.1 paired box protein pax-6, putative [Schistosoma mansoni]
MPSKYGACPFQWNNDNHINIYSKQYRLHEKQIA